MKTPSEIGGQVWPESATGVDVELVVPTQPARMSKNTVRTVKTPILASGAIPSQILEQLGKSSDCFNQVPSLSRRANAAYSAGSTLPESQRRSGHRDRVLMSQYLWRFYIDRPRFSDYPCYPEHWDHNGGPVSVAYRRYPAFHYSGK